MYFYISCTIPKLTYSFLTICKRFIKCVLQKFALSYPLYRNRLKFELSTWIWNIREQWTGKRFRKKFTIKIITVFYWFKRNIIIITRRIFIEKTCKTYIFRIHPIPFQITTANINICILVSKSKYLNYSINPSNVYYNIMYSYK